MEKPRQYDIKDAARYLGIPPSTLRYWESKGLVQAGRDKKNDYRRYSLHDLINASEVAFYRELGVSVKELEGYRTLSPQALDSALARTELDMKHRIAELETSLSRLSQQRSLNAQAKDLQQQGMRPGLPTIEQLTEITYDSPELWKLLVEEPWRYGVLINADEPDKTIEAAVEGPQTHNTAILWHRSENDNLNTCRECLLKVAPTTGANNARSLLTEACEQGLQPRTILGTYLLTATENDERWDYHRAWVLE